MIKLYRVILQVSDIEAASSFYGKLLDQRGRRVSPGRHYFDCGGTILTCFDPEINCYYSIMSKAEIIAELSNLSPNDLADVQAKLDELAGAAWQNHGELSDADKTSLNAALSEYEKSPEAGSIWDEVKARVQAKLRP